MENAWLPHPPGSQLQDRTHGAQGTLAKFISFLCFHFHDPVTLLQILPGPFCSLGPVARGTYSHGTCPSFSSVIIDCVEDHVTAVYIGT